MIEAIFLKEAILGPLESCKASTLGVVIVV